MIDPAQLKKLEDDLWEAADQLRANSKLTSTEYYMPVLGVIFLRHATNRFNVAHAEVEQEITHREPVQADYVKRRALFLPEKARFDAIVDLPKSRNLGKAVNAAMKAIEESFEPLKGALPRDYEIFERDLLDDLLKIFNRETLKEASGDVFGRIYEYFLMKFAMQGAQDAGEFFTPPSLVQTIVNVIEPDHGNVFDPACGSGGMFVQSSHFIESEGKDTAKVATFYGQEKTAATIRLAKMNLAVHGLEGKILEANTFYQDEHTLVGNADFVMANPPFNVDMVDAEKIEGDLRLPFGLPGVNKKKKVSNANYLWASYFYTYLNEKGRAGFVMSSQSSSAGGQEMEVRRKIIQTGHVDVMIAIRGGFFYTRTVPCELWFYDKGKAKKRQNTVLMLDARNVHQKMTRTVYEFAPEQLQNLTAIVWLYRGETKRFKKLLAGYAAECASFRDTIAEHCQPVDTELAKLRDRVGALKADETSTRMDATYQTLTLPLDAMAANLKGGKFADSESHSKLAGACRKLRQVVQETKRSLEGILKEVLKLDPKKKDDWRAVFGQMQTGLNSLQVSLTENETTTRHYLWLRDRFPDDEYVDVEGLCKAVDLPEIEENDWSLTPGRYVGVAPEEDDPDFDFDTRMKEIHEELAVLNGEAAKLTKTIHANWNNMMP